jgi:hypothetical protein
MKNRKPVKKIRLTRDQENLMSRVADSLRDEDRAAANEHWSHLIQSLVKATPGVNEQDVSHLAWQALWEAGLAADIPEVASPEDLETCIKEMEEALETVGDDAQLANVDMQNMLQKQQQTLDMLKIITKLLNDTALSVIRKMAG